MGVFLSGNILRRVLRGDDQGDDGRMSEYIVELPISGAADEFIAKHGVDDCWLYGYKLTGEIVRCRDCAYSIHFLHHDDERWQCAEPHQEGDDVKPDGYCWRGKQKEGK